MVIHSLRIVKLGPVAALAVHCSRVAAHPAKRRDGVRRRCLNVADASSDGVRHSVTTKRAIAENVHCNADRLVECGGGTGSRIGAACRSRSCDCGEDIRHWIPSVDLICAATRDDDELVEGIKFHLTRVRRTGNFPVFCTSCCCFY